MTSRARCEFRNLGGQNFWKSDACRREMVDGSAYDFCMPNTGQNSLHVELGNTVQATIRLIVEHAAEAYVVVRPVYSHLHASHA